MLEDLVEIDSLILDLEGRDYVLSVNAYETLERVLARLGGILVFTGASARRSDL